MPTVASALTGRQFVQAGGTEPSAEGLVWGAELRGGGLGWEDEDVDLHGAKRQHLLCLQSLDSI